MTFDFTNDTAVESKKSFEPLPKGVYKSLISKCEIVPTQAGDNMLSGSVDILSPSEHKGRKVFFNCLLEHKKSDKVDSNGHIEYGMASRIGRAKAKQLVEATTGKLTIDHFETLVGKPVGVSLIVKSDPKYGMRNDVVEFCQSEKVGIMPGAQTMKSEPHDVPF